MRRPLRRVGTAITVLIVLLLGNLTYLQVVKAAAFRADPHNSRTSIEQYNRERGQITAADGTVLAQSVPSNDVLRYQRRYPGGQTYGALTGYYSTLYGATGIEQTENSFLAGEDDSLLGGQISDLITGRDPRGGNVQLTVIPAVQQAAFSALTSNGYAGAVVAIKPSTGEILALATTPSYDPTPLASHSETVQRTESDIINTGTPSVKLNRATAQVYPPGSTFKLIDSAAAFQDGYTPTTPVTGRSTLSLPGGGSLSNFGDETCGDGGGAEVTFTEALAHSCNTAFAEVALKLGAPAIKSAAANLGVGATFDIGLDVARSAVGIVPDAAALAQTAIGQRDVVFTPFLNAVIASTVADHGVRMVPHLIARTTAPDLSVVSETKPVVESASAIPAAVADSIRDMMIQSEKDTAGYAGESAVGNVVIASKTGTAEHGTNPKNTAPHCWYVAFAPADDPQIAVAVLVENGGNGDLGATGGKVAAPVGRAVIVAALGAR